MRRAVGILTTAVVPVFIAALAFAGEPYGSERGKHEHGTTAGSAGAAGFMGEHTMTGRITDIDKNKGHVKIDAQGEKLDLHFPQSALQNLREGEEVTVSLGIKPAGGTAGTRGGTTGMPGSRGSESMPGSRGSEAPGTR